MSEQITLNNLFYIVNKYGLKISQIIDAGAFDLTESIILCKRFNAFSLAFECNPYSIDLCYKNINDQIIFIPECVNLYKGTCEFYINDPIKTITPHPNGNQAAASLFRANHEYPCEKYIQKKITVSCDRIDNVMNDNKIKKADLLWLDMQGAELIAFKSMGDHLKNVDIIVCELMTKSMYLNSPLFPEVNNYLNNNGFEMVNGNPQSFWFGNFIYLNKKFLN